MIKPLPVRCGMLLAVMVLWCNTGPAAAQNDPTGIEFFETKIRPALVQRCYECHSTKAAKVKGGLLLDTKAGIRKGGDTGPAVIPGDIERSLLLKSLRHDGLKMPPKEMLSEEVVADFVRWVKMGAPDPREVSAAVPYKKLTLEEARRFWSFQPPRKAEPPKVRNLAWPKNDIDRFVLAKLEEKGLKPMADAARRPLIRRVYFDLIGLPPEPEEVKAFVEDSSLQALEKVVDRLLESPHFGERWGRHWLDVARYAESNGNLENFPFPYAWRYRDYVIAALNNDKPYDRFVTEQIAGDLLPAEDLAHRDEQLIATGFLALTCKPKENPNYTMDLVADQIDVTSRAVLGLSVLCARCHDHKFDPISTREYYALAGIFDSTAMLFGTLNQKKGGSLYLPGSVHVLSDQSNAMGVKDGKAVETAICIGGEALQRGDTVRRGFLTVATIAEPPAIDSNQSGRLQLARWLTQPENPLTARVAVNRVWMHLLGRGLVRTVDNFGVLGEPPTHLELLDFLALRLMGDGWSIKKTIRAIVLSRTYQLSSDHDAANYELDPDNVWLWRKAPRRLEAEPLRDAMLAASGRLERRPPQGSLSPFDPARAIGMPTAGAKSQNQVAAETNHRSVYLGNARGAPLPELLSLFDAANPNQVVSERDVTTVPGQALCLLNSPFVLAQARHMAERILAIPDLDEAGRVNRAYQLALGRPAATAEQERAVLFIRKRAPSPGTGNPTEADGWSLFCQALLACAEFRYLE